MGSSGRLETALTAEGLAAWLVQRGELHLHLRWDGGYAHWRIALKNTKRCNPETCFRVPFGKVGNVER